jgi:hypothetical protein
MMENDGVLRIHDWIERRVTIRGTMPDGPAWAVPIDLLWIEWGFITDRSMPRYFCRPMAGGKVINGLTAIRFELDRGTYSDPEKLQVQLRLASDGRVTRAARWSSRARRNGKDPRVFREDQVMCLRASIVAWLEACGESPMLV